MHAFLAKIYGWSKRHPWLYPLYLTLRIPVIFPTLVRNEGLTGAIRWLYFRFKFVWQNRKIYDQPDFFNQPVNVFHSRFGFTLSHLMEYVIYDEIFLDRCYDFVSLRELLRQQQGLPVVDWGTHHGMFINFVQSLGHQGEYWGAELNPDTFAKACKRFVGQKNVTLLNFGIAGYARDITICQTAVSTMQSIYSQAGDKPVKASLITPAEFAARTNLAGREIALLKIDIEGAEKEIFERFDCIKDLLISTRMVVIEIHDSADVPLIHRCLESVGFHRRDQNGINYFYARPSTS